MVDAGFKEISLMKTKGRKCRCSERKERRDDHGLRTKRILGKIPLEAASATDTNAALYDAQGRLPVSDNGFRLPSIVPSNDKPCTVQEDGKPKVSNTTQARCV